MVTLSASWLMRGMHRLNMSIVGSAEIHLARVPRGLLLSSVAVVVRVTVFCKSGSVM